MYRLDVRPVIQPTVSKQWQKFNALRSGLIFSSSTTAGRGTAPIMPALQSQDAEITPLTEDNILKQQAWFSGKGFRFSPAQLATTSAKTYKWLQGAKSEISGHF